MPADARDGILRGMYLLRDGDSRRRKDAARAALRLGRDSARGRRRRRPSRQRLERAAATSGALRASTSCSATASPHSDGTCCTPRKRRKRPYVEECLRGRRGPGVAATDYIRTFAQQIQPFVGRRYVALGTDGYGRSDFRRKLREFFEVDRHFVTMAALRALADEGAVPAATVAKAVAEIRHRSQQSPTRSPYRRSEMSEDRGTRSRHRRLQRRSGYRSAGQERTIASRRTTRSSRWRARRPRWRCPPRRTASCKTSK